MLRALNRCHRSMEQRAGAAAHRAVCVIHQPGVSGAAPTAALPLSLRQRVRPIRIFTQIE